MKQISHILLLVGIVILISLVACAPQATPPASPTPAMALQPAPTAPTTKAISPEEAAWNVIVEAAKKEGTFTIYSYSLVGDIGIAVSRAFKDAYGISMDNITGRGAEFLERVKTEKRMGRLVADMTEGNATHLKNMKKEGLTVSLAKEVPVLREKDVWVADIFTVDSQDKHVIIYNFTIYSPYVNINIIKPGEEPKVWKDLLDTKWKSRMAITDPLTSAGPSQLFVPLLREKVIDMDFLKALYKQDLRFSTALPDEAGILARGERSLSIRGVDSVYARFIAEGAPIKVVEMKDGTVLAVLAVTAFDGAPHPNATKVFVNWFLSPEGQTVYGKAASVASARKDVPNFLPKAAQITPQRPIILNSEDTDEATRLFRERWLDKLWGRR